MTAAPFAERRIQDRRVERSRRTLELLLDGVFRPGNWAAALSYRFGLQGQLQVAEHTFRISRTAARVRPLRVAFASDFHAGATTDVRLLERAAVALMELHPDVLLLGGDFVSVRASYIDRLAPLIAEIEAPFGKFGVLGNHDLRANWPRVVGALEGAGVRMLDNERVTLPAPFEDVTICGLDDPVRGTPRPEHSLDGAQGTRLVLMHSPEALPMIGDRAFDVAFCGHTHGGQVALPWGTPLLLPGGPLNRRYYAGQFDVDGATPRKLLVSRGVGCSTLPVRLFAAPEVHLCLIV